MSDLRSKAKTHVTGKRAALEEIGNKVATRGTHISKVKEHLKSLYREKLDCCSVLNNKCFHYRKQNVPKHL